VAAKGFQPFDGFGIPPENGEAASIDLRSIFGTLLRHWKLVSIVPLLALIGTYVIFMFVPQQFKSTTEILIANPKLQNEAGQPPSVFDIDEAAMSTEIVLIQSKSLALRVARELHLDKNDKFMRMGLSSQVQRLFSQVLEGLGLSHPNTSDLTGQAKETPEQADAALDAAAEQLRGLIKADREGMSYVLSISITTPDPATSQRITDTVAKDFFAEQLEARSAALERAAGWLTNWASELRTGLSDTEAQIEKLKAESRRCDRQPA
jgi:succinoglycan biosynthesis transport protein ExoP